MTTDSTGNWVFINPETYESKAVSDALENIISKQSKTLELDGEVATLAYSEKEITNRFFKNVIDQPYYIVKEDHKRLRSFIVDWYSSFKTHITKLRKSLDLYVMTNEELNEMILSFGFPYPNNILTKKHKIAFIKNLINPLYLKKGTPEALAKAIGFYGLSDVIISEWWIYHEKNKLNEFYAKSRIVYPDNLKNNPTYEIEKTYEEFIDGNPYWQLSLGELKKLYYDSTNKITLPSIAPVISIQSHINISELEFVFSVINRKMQECYDYWMKYTLSTLDLTTITNVLEFQSVPVEGYYMVVSEPPTIDQINENEIYEKVIVGSSPSSDFENHEHKIATWNGSSWTFSTPVNGKVLLVHRDSVLVADKLIRYDSVAGKWKVFSIYVDTTFKVYDRLADTTSSVVWNSTEYVDMLDEFSSCKVFGLGNTLNRDVYLNGFSASYSILEVMLAIAYLFKQSLIDNQENLGTDHIAEQSESRFHFYFDKDKITNWTPFDKPYATTTDSTCGSIDLSDNIDNIMESSAKYEPLIDYYNNIIFNRNDPNVLSFRHNYSADPLDTELPSYRLQRKTPFERQKELKQLYVDVLTKPNDFSIDSIEYALMNPEPFLKAINPDFFNEVVAIFGNDTTLIDRISSDLEIYLTDNMNIISIPLTFILQGSSFYTTRIKPVVDFFKPFRVKVLDFLSILDIKNPLLDSMLMNDTVSNDVELFIVEKPFPRNIDTVDDSEDFLFDHGFFTDELMKEIYIQVHEKSYAPVGDNMTYRLPIEEDDDIIYSIGYSNPAHVLDLQIRDYVTVEITSGDLYGEMVVEDGEITFVGDEEIFTYE